MSDLMADPDEYAAAVVQQYMHEHGMQAGINQTHCSLDSSGNIGNMVEVAQCLQFAPHSLGCVDSASGYGESKRTQICAWLAA